MSRLQETWVWRQAGVWIRAARDDVAALQLGTRAAAMSYASVMALVPSLLLVAWLLKVSGLAVYLSHHLQDTVAVTLFQSFPEVRDVLLPALWAADLTRLGIASLLGLVVVTANLLLWITDACDHILGVAYKRPLWAKLARAGLGVLVMPLCYAVIASQIRSRFGLHAEGLQRWIVLMVLWLAVVSALKILPTVEVSWRAAIAGSLCTLLAGLAVHLGFASYITWFASGDPVRKFFGSIGAIPAFLLWLYLVWLTLLGGMEVTALVQFGPRRREAQAKARSAA